MEEGHRRTKSERNILQKKGGRHATLLILKMQAKGQQAKACRWSLEAGRGKEKNSFLDPLKKDAVL